MSREGDTPGVAATGASAQPVEDGVAPDAGTGVDEAEPQGPAPGTVTVTERHKSTGELARELIPEIGIGLIALYLFILAGEFGGQREGDQLGPAFWPRMAAVGLMVAVVVRMFQTVRDRDRPIVHVVTEFDEYEEEETELSWPRLWIGLGLAVGYVLATMFIGYPLASAIFLTAFIWIGGQRKWYVPLIAIAGALVFTYVFIGVVYVSLPTGVGIFDTITVGLYNLLGIQ
jgi:hypothetical protein